MKIPEAASVYLPRPSTAKLKIPPHIIEVQRPQSAINMMLIGTCATPNEISLLNTGILTIVVIGQIKARIMNRIPTPDATVSIALLVNLPPKEAPTRRPINIRNQ